MGTNYYHEPLAPCETCKRPFERKHIGKSSAGWCFSLHVYPEDGINDLADWQKRWHEGRIVDEYGRVIAPLEMWEKITMRASHATRQSNLQWYNDNHAIPGPHGLARAAISRDCIGHGYGTWDLIVGDFS